MAFRRGEDGEATAHLHGRAKLAGFAVTMARQMSRRTAFQCQLDRLLHCHGTSLRPVRSKGVLA